MVVFAHRVQHVSVHTALESVLVHAQVADVHELLALIKVLAAAVMVVFEADYSAILAPLRAIRSVGTVAGSTR